MAKLKLKELSQAFFHEFVMRKKGPHLTDRDWFDLFPHWLARTPPEQVAEEICRDVAEVIAAYAMLDEPEEKVMNRIELARHRAVKASKNYAEQAESLARAKTQLAELFEMRSKKPAGVLESEKPGHEKARPHKGRA